MKDAFGVERGDEVAKAFSLRPVKDFVSGASRALGMSRKAGPLTPGAANVAGKTSSGLGQAKQAFGAVKTGAATGFGAAKAKMPSLPKPSKRAMGTAAAIGGTGVVAGGAGYAAGKPDWQR